MGDCRCSNITIMQLFHELKQRFPTVPDHVVSKVIEQNCHDKTACETILQQESHLYVQCYPGALISGEGRSPGPHPPLSDRCSLGPGPPRRHQRLRETPTDCDAPQHSNATTTPSEDDSPTPSQPRIRTRPHPPTLEDKIDRWNSPMSQLVREVIELRNNRMRASQDSLDDVGSSSLSSDESNKKQSVSSTNTPQESPSTEVAKPLLAASPPVAPEPLVLPDVPLVTQPENKTPEQPIRPSSVPSTPPKRPSSLACDNTKKPGKSSNGGVSSNKVASPSSPRSPGQRVPFKSSPNPPSCKRLLAPFNEVYCSDVPCCCTTTYREIPLQSSVLSSPQGYKLAVECEVRPSLPGVQPKASTSVHVTLQPQRPDANHPNDSRVAYSTVKVDPQQGYQSSLHIVVTSTLLELQRKRKDLLAGELTKEKEKLNSMREQVRAMHTALQCKPNPQVIAKLKGDVDRLHAECKKLTAAVDRYSEQANVPLGETNENFYSNIYTGRQQQRGGWSCRRCTFRNHPLLQSCEQCEMLRLPPIGTTPTPRVSNPVLSNNNSSCAAGETSASVSRTIAPIQER